MSNGMYRTHVDINHTVAPPSRHSHDQQGILHTTLHLMLLKHYSIELYLGVVFKCDQQVTEGASVVMANNIKKELDPISNLVPYGIFSG